MSVVLRTLGNLYFIPIVCIHIYVYCTTNWRHRIAKVDKRNSMIIIIRACPADGEKVNDTIPYTIKKILHITYHRP